LGDEAQNAAILPLLPELRAYARFLVRRTGDADDLVQDAVLRAVAAMNQFQPGSNLRAWLFTILRNTFYEQNRRRRTEIALLDRMGTQDDVAAPDQPGHMDLSDLGKALFGLPAILREAVVLVGAQGLSYEEAAIICAVPVGTIKARVSRGRSLLADRLRTGGRHETPPGEAAGAPVERIG
jgi:RNA polymerase sigma-70 factor (ECF subfamily)